MEVRQIRCTVSLKLHFQPREAAVDELLEIVRRNRDWNEQQARKQLVKFFEVFGSSDPLTISSRRRLSSILFS